MYKLLLVTDQENIRYMFQHQIDFAKLGCREPLIADTASEAIEYLGSRAIDAVGYFIDRKKGRELIHYLITSRPSLPIYKVVEDPEKQIQILTETRVVLNRLHADFADDYYDEETMLNMQRDELTHNMLCGRIDSWETLERGLKLIRSKADPYATCVLYEIDLPQGEVYVTEHSQAQERLESALRNNFFGRYVENIYYAVAVLTPRHIRLVCIPMVGREPEDKEVFAARADRHVQESIQKIKEYLDLDLRVMESAWLNGLKELIEA